MERSGSAVRPAPPGDMIPAVDIGAPVDGVRSRRARWPFVVVGVVLVAGAGALWLSSATRDPAGASSPEAAVREFAAAVNGDDPLLILRAVSPAEVSATRDLLDDIIAGLDRLGVTAWGASEGGGFDIEVDVDGTDVVEARGTEALVAVDGSVRIDGLDIAPPLGLVVPGRLDVSFDDIAERLDSLGGGSTLTVVLEDGRWYVSPVRTAIRLGDVSSLLDDALTGVSDALGDTIGGAIDDVLVDANDGSDG